MKKMCLALIALVLSFCVLAGCSSSNEQLTEEATATAEPTATAVTLKTAEFNIGVLAGPTGMGMSKLMSDAKEDKYENKYNVELFSAPTDVTGLLISGELDIAALPTNLASTLYNKTGGKIKLLAINTLGVLYILERGDTIHSVEDLEGKTIYSSGQASTPEYALNYVLQQKNINCKVEYFSTHAELATQALAGNADIILIPEPQVSNILAKSSDFRIAVDFNEAWNDACGNSATLSMGCLAVRADFAEENKEALEAFMADYTASVNFVNSNPAEAAQLIAETGIVPSAAIAQSAIPNSKIVALTGEEMREKTLAFLQILYESNASSIGGAIPGEDFFA